MLGRASSRRRTHQRLPFYCVGRTAPLAALRNTRDRKGPRPPRPRRHSSSMGLGGLRNRLGVQASVPLPPTPHSEGRTARGGRRRASPLAGPRPFVFPLSAWAAVCSAAHLITTFYFNLVLG